MTEKPKRYTVRKQYAGIDDTVAAFRCEEDEQVVILTDGAALALHKLLGGMSLNDYRSRGLSDDEASALHRIYNVLF